MKPTHTMYYIHNNLKHIDCGKWNIRTTKTQVIFTKTDLPLYPEYVTQNTGDINAYEIKVKKSNIKSKHRVNIYDNGNYTLYPYCAGTPHVFELIKDEQ